MPANIMQNWSHLAPQKDFFESFVAPLIMGQEMAKKQAEQEQLQIQNQYLPQTYEAEILGQQLLNEERQATNPYAGKNAEAELMGQLLLNENRGLENQYMPQNQQIKQQEHALAQAVRNMQMQKYEAEINQINNPAEFNPLGQPGAGGQVALANWYESKGDTKSAELVRDAIKADRSALDAWRSTPPSVRRDSIAAAKGLGFSEQEAVNMFAQGFTLPEMAEMKGIPKENIEKYERIYGPSPQAINAAQQRTAADVELNSLTNAYTEWVAPYVDPLNIGGYSIDEIVEVVSGEGSSDKRNKFIAGTMLAQEIPMLRIRLGQGMNGIEAIREMKETSMVNLNSLKERVTPEDFIKINKLVNDELGKAANLANRAIYNPEIQIKEANEKYGSIGEGQSTQNNYNSLSKEEADARIAELKAELGE